MSDELRVCPQCGKAAGERPFCASCGTNLTTIDRLPSRSEWLAANRQEAGLGSGAGPSAAEEVDPGAGTGMGYPQIPGADRGAESRPAEASRAPGALATSQLKRPNTMMAAAAGAVLVVAVIIAAAASGGVDAGDVEERIEARGNRSADCQSLDAKSTSAT